MIQRGQVRWADLGPARGSAPAHRRPVLVAQIDRLSASRIATVAVVILTSNLRLADVPGNVLVEPEDSGLPERSVVNVTQLISVDKDFLDDRPTGLLPLDLMARIDDGLRLVLGL